MKVSAHQPHYFLWLGYLHKIFNCDLFVILDICDYEKSYFQNRVQIKTNTGIQYITVPVGKHQKPICDMVIDNKINWIKKHSKTLYLAYKATPFFNLYWDKIQSDIFDKEWHYLCNLNVATLKLILDLLEVDTPIYVASELQARGKRDDWIINVCLELGADTYLFGKSGRNYYDPEKFKRNNIKVEFQNFQHPIYEQQYNKYGFVQGLSYLDALFNIGASALRELLYET